MPQNIYKYLIKYHFFYLTTTVVLSILFTWWITHNKMFTFGSIWGIMTGLILLNTLSTMYLLKKLKGSECLKMCDHAKDFRQKHQKMQRELEIAKKIQEDFLPTVLPEVCYASVYANSLFVYDVGGDYYDIIKLKNNNLFFAIADVMGKGIPASLFMAMTKISLHTVLKFFSEPNEVLEKMNYILYDDLNKSKSFVTMSCALYQHETKKLLISSAGHNYPLIFRSSTGMCEFIKTKGVFLGGLPEKTYKMDTVTLKTGDIVLFYTDGLKEAKNDFNQEFGLERVKNVLIKNHMLDAQQIADEIFINLFDFIGTKCQEDDITMIIFKVLQ